MENGHVNIFKSREVNGAQKRVSVVADGRVQRIGWSSSWEGLVKSPNGPTLVTQSKTRGVCLMSVIDHLAKDEAASENETPTSDDG